MKLVVSAALTGVLVTNTAANAASLEVDFQATIASEQHPDYGGPARYYHVSVNPANPGIGSYAATVVGTNNPAGTFTRSFTEPVVGYKWIGGTNNDISGVALAGGKAGRIVYATQDTAFDGFGQDQLKFWDATNPGPDIATGGADPFNATDDFGGGSGYRAFGGATGTIDVSGLFYGSFYLFYGGFGSTPSVSAVLKDTDGGAPDIVISNAHLNGDTADRTEYYVAELDFVTDGVYDTLEFEHLANGINYSGNGRGLGSLLTGSTSPPANLTLQVDTVTGAMKMVGDDNTPVSLSYYQIISDGGSLNAAGWASLEDSDFEGNGPASGTGDGWEEAGGSDANALSEGYLLGDSTILAAQEINLGSAYNTAVDAQDLVFSYASPSGGQFEGLVQYVTSSIPGDTDGDGDIDDSDLGTSFSNYTGPLTPGTGNKTAAQGDTDGDGDVDDSDLGTSFSGYTGPIAVNVPEPGAAAMLAMGGLALMRRRSSR